MNPVSLPEATTIVGWALIHFVWQGILLAAALGITRLIVPRGFVRLRYAAGCVTLAAMLAAPAATATYLAGAGTVAPVREPAAHPAAGPHTAPHRTSGPFTAATDAGRGFALPIPAATELMPALVTAWALGVLFCAVRLGGGWWHARRLVRVDTHRAPEALEGLGRAIARRLGLSRATRLLVSTRVQVPLVVGWLRPVLLVPAAVVSGLPAQQLEAVLAHELAHVRRHDYLVNLLQAVVETLLFYHPAVWWVSHTVREEREHCCDDLAVAACGDPIAYARALTAVESCREDRAALALAASGGSLVARVRRLLGVAPPRHVSTSHWAVAALTALMVSGAGATNLLDGFSGSWMSAGIAQKRADPLPRPAGEPSAAAVPVPVPLPQPSPAAPVPARQPEAPEAAPERVPAPVVEGESERGLESELQAAMAEYRRALEEAQRARAEAMDHYRRALDELHRARAEVRARMQSDRAARIEARRLAAEAREMAHEAMAEARKMVRAARRAAAEARRAARTEKMRSSDRDGMPPPPPAPPAPPATPAAPPSPAIPAVPDVPPVPAVPPVPPVPPAPPPDDAAHDGSGAGR